MNWVPIVGTAVAMGLAPTVQKYCIQPLLRSLQRLPDGFIKRVLLLKIGK